MTVSKSEDRATTVRFTFLSLLNLGTATVLWLVGLTFAVGRFHSGSVGKGIVLLLIALMLSIPFLQRRFYFYRTSIQLPFSTAVSVLREQQQSASKGPTPNSTPTRHGNRPVVYLAGGLRSGWQDDVIAAAQEFQYLDPRDHGLKDAAAYTVWDLEAIRQCDLVFAYLEETNPGGFALALEVGYGAALGKPIILVDDKSEIDKVTRRYFPMVRECATYAAESFEDGIRFLKASALLAPAK